MPPGYGTTSPPLGERPSGQHPPGQPTTATTSGRPGPAPVRVPGAETTTSQPSARAEQILGPALQILEPTSHAKRFFTSYGSLIGLLPFLLFGVLFPGVFLLIGLIGFAEGVTTAVGLMQMILIVAVFVWLPFGIFYGNLFLAVGQTFVSVHQGGLFIRTAPYVFFLKNEVSIPFHQIVAIKSGMVDSKLNRVTGTINPLAQEMANSLAKGNLQILTQTGQRHRIVAFDTMFTRETIANFTSLLQRYMR